MLDNLHKLLGASGSLPINVNNNSAVSHGCCKILNGLIPVLRTALDAYVILVLSAASQIFNCIMELNLNSFVS